MGTKLKNQERVVYHNIMKLATVKKFMPVEVLPLVGAVTTGVCLSAYALRHHAVYNPDISTKSRTTYGWERFESAQKMNRACTFWRAPRPTTKPAHSSRARWPRVAFSPDHPNPSSIRAFVSSTCT